MPKVSELTLEAMILLLLATGCNTPPTPKTHSLPAKPASSEIADDAVLYGRKGHYNPDMTILLGAHGTKKDLQEILNELDGAAEKDTPYHRLLLDSYLNNEVALDINNFYTHILHQYKKAKQAKSKIDDKAAARIIQSTLEKINRHTDYSFVIPLVIESAKRGVLIQHGESYNDEELERLQDLDREKDELLQAIIHDSPEGKNIVDYCNAMADQCRYRNTRIGQVIEKVAAPKSRPTKVGLFIGCMHEDALQEISAYKMGEQMSWLPFKTVRLGDPHS